LTRHASAMGATSELLAVMQRWLAEPPREFNAAVDAPWAACLAATEIAWKR